MRERLDTAVIWLTVYISEWDRNMLSFFCRLEGTRPPFDWSSLRHAPRRVLLSLGVLWLGLVLAPRTGHAVDPAVDLAVEAFAIGGAAISVPVGKHEKVFLKGLVQCAVDGRPVLECGKEALIQTVLGGLPKESQAFAGCIASGGNVARCASNEMINKLPPGAARTLASCVAQGREVSDCGKQIATAQLTEAQRSALATLANVKADAGVSLTRSTSSIQNIINVADGIARGDWEVVIKNGGKVAAKYVIRTVLTALLSQAGTALAGPVIDALVENRMDLAIDLINALKSGDPGRIARATVQAYLYLSLPVVQACALFPSGAVKEAVCGFVADILGEIADFGGKVVDTAADEGEKRYNDIQDFLSGNRDDCGTRWQYYDGHFAFCKYQAAIAKERNHDSYAKMEESLYQGCRAHFHPCAKRLIGSTSDRISDICNPVRDKFRREVDGISGSLKDRVGAFARGYVPQKIQLEHGENCETRSSQNFIVDCIKALQKQDQDQDLRLSGSCRVDGIKKAPAPSYLSACIDASFVGDSADLRPNLMAQCTYPVETPPPTPVLRPPLQLQTPEGQCPEGTRPVGRYRCVPIAAPPPPVQPPPRIVQPPPQIVQPPPPVLPPPPTCRDGMVLEAGGGCECRQGTVLSGGRCVQPCPPGMTGTPPNCRCPGGSVLSGGEVAFSRARPA